MFDAPFLENLSGRYVQAQIMHDARLRNAKRMIKTVLVHFQSYAFAFVRLVSFDKKFSISLCFEHLGV